MRVFFSERVELLGSLNVGIFSKRVELLNEGIFFGAVRDTQITL